MKCSIVWAAHCHFGALPIFFRAEMSRKHLLKGRCWWEDVKWVVATAQAGRKTAEALTAESFNWARRWPPSGWLRTCIAGGKIRRSRGSELPELPERSKPSYSSVTFLWFGGWIWNLFYTSSLLVSSKSHMFFLTAVLHVAPWDRIWLFQS